jgi:phage-related protein
MPDRPIIIYNGSLFAVEGAISANGECESKDFLDALGETERAKILKIIKRLANFGVVQNREQFKKVEGEIWEFKEFQRRILMYYLPNRRIVLTHGFIKKGDRIPRSEIERANTIRHEYNQIRERMKP